MLVLHSGSQLTLWNTKRAGEIVWTVSIPEPLTTFNLDPFTPNRICLVTGRAHDDLSRVLEVLTYICLHRCCNCAR